MLIAEILEHLESIDLAYAKGDLGNLQKRLQDAALLTNIGYECLRSVVSSSPEDVVALANREVGVNGSLVTGLGSSEETPVFGPSILGSSENPFSLPFSLGLWTVKQANEASENHDPIGWL